MHAYPNKEGGGPQTGTKLPQNHVAGDFYDAELFVLSSKYIKYSYSNVTTFIGRA